MMPPEQTTDIRAWSANDPARPEVAWSASLGLMMRWPGDPLWHYGPWGSAHYQGQPLPADAVLLVPDWPPAGQKRSGGVQR
jgi:hypothetical protein